MEFGAGFGGFVFNADFDEDAEFFCSVEFCSGVVEALSQGEIVYRVDRVKNFRGASGFVALQVADQVPGSWQVFELRALPFPFLDAVFAEVAKAGFVGFADGFGGMGFGDGD